MGGWETVLIGALVGSLFGFVSRIVFDWVKERGVSTNGAVSRRECLEVRARMEDRFRWMCERFDEIAARLDGMEKSIEKLNERLLGMKYLERMEGLEEKVGKIKYGELERRVEELSRKIDMLSRDMEEGER